MTNTLSGWWTVKYKYYEDQKCNTIHYFLPAKFYTLCNHMNSIDTAFIRDEYPNSRNHDYVCSHCNAYIETLKKLK